MNNCAGRIFLSPKGSRETQFWLNLGYDSFDGYAIPPFIPEFLPICSKQQYEELMEDVAEYFRRYSQGSCCTFTVRHRPKFEEGLERLLRYHQRASQKWRPGETPTISAWKPGTMKYVSLAYRVYLACFSNLASRHRLMALPSPSLR
jgi:hypothetical protein